MTFCYYASGRVFHSQGDIGKVTPPYILDECICALIRQLLATRHRDTRNGSGAEWAAMSACGIRAGNGISDFKMPDDISAGGQEVAHSKRRASILLCDLP